MLLTWYQAFIPSTTLVGPPLRSSLRRRILAHCQIPFWETPLKPKRELYHPLSTCSPPSQFRLPSSDKPMDRIPTVSITSPPHQTTSSQKFLSIDPPSSINDQDPLFGHSKPPIRSRFVKEKTKIKNKKQESTPREVIYSHSKPPSLLLIIYPECHPQCPPMQSLKRNKNNLLSPTIVTSLLETKHCCIPSHRQPHSSHPCLMQPPPTRIKPRITKIYLE